MITAKIREDTAHLARRDPGRLRFGAASHDYAFRPRLTPARLEEIARASGATLPEDYERFVLEVGDGGSGPGYGLLPLDHPTQLASMGKRCDLGGALTPVRDPDPETKAFYDSDARLDGTVILSDHGCCYLSVLVVDRASAAFGRVYADLRSADVGLIPTHPSFGDWYDEWLRDSLHEPPLVRSRVPASHCAPPHALANYLGNFEQKHGVGPGELSTEQVREALLGVGDGGLANRTEANRGWDDGDPVRICMLCQAMIDRFVARGMMRPAQIVPGLPPKPARG